MKRLSPCYIIGLILARMNLCMICRARLVCKRWNEIVRVECPK
ncbi:MAG: F-box protein [Sulfobacillus sp.]